MYRLEDTTQMPYPAASGALQPVSLARREDSANREFEIEDKIPVYNIAYSQYLANRSVHANNTRQQSKQILHTSGYDYFSLPNSPPSGEEVGAFTATTSYPWEPAVTAPFYVQDHQSALIQDNCEFFAPDTGWSSPLGSASNGANISYRVGQSRPFQSPSSSDDPGFVFGSFETIYTPGPSTGSPQELGEFFQWPPDIDEGNPIFDLELSASKNQPAQLENEFYNSQISESLFPESMIWTDQGAEQMQTGGPFFVDDEPRDQILDSNPVGNEFSRLGPCVETGEPWNPLSALDPDTQRAQVFEKPLIPDFHGVPTNTLFGPLPIPNEQTTESWTHVFPSLCAEEHSHSPNSWYFEHESGISKKHKPNPEQRRKGGRKGKMSDEKKRITQAVRKAVACWPCYLRKVKCSTESRCTVCQKFTNPRKPVLLPCFRDPVEVMSPILVPSYIFGHITLKEVHRVVKSEVHSWGSEKIPIKLSWGSQKMIDVEVSVVYPSSFDSNIMVQCQAITDKNGRPKLMRTKSPLLGIPLDTLGSLQERYANYVRDFVQDEAYLAEYSRNAYVGEPSELPGRLLKIICSWYIESKRNGAEPTMLREAIETHVICSIIDRSLLLDQDSYENARRRLEHEFPRRAAPRLAQRQLKFIFFQGQDQRIRSVLQNWGKSIRKIDTPSPTLWPIDICVLAIMCLVMDMTIRSAYDIYLHKMNTQQETNDRELRKIVRIIETELFQKAKEIFHLRHRTRKGSAKETYNPLRDDVDPHGSENWWSLKLIEELRQLVSCVGKSPAGRNVPATSDVNSYEESGRLTQIFLSDFLL